MALEKAAAQSYIILGSDHQIEINSDVARTNRSSVIKLGGLMSSTLDLQMECLDNVETAEFTTREVFGLVAAALGGGAVVGLGIGIIGSILT